MITFHDTAVFNSSLATPLATPLRDLLKEYSINRAKALEVSSASEEFSQHVKDMVAIEEEILRRIEDPKYSEAVETFKF